MIVKASAPSRIGLFGGSTDIPSFAEIAGGIVINMAINIRSYVTLYIEEDVFNFPYSKVPQGANTLLFYKILEEYRLGSMHHATFDSSFDGVVGAGLGSSASASVALIGAISRTKKQPIDRTQIARFAQYMEVIKLGWYGGKQDQLAAVHGGVNLFHIGKNITAVPYSPHLAERLAAHMVLFYIGGTRSSKTIQEGFKKLTPDQLKALNELKDLTILADYAIRHEKFDMVGKLLNKAWELKKNSNKDVSNTKIDAIYEYAKKQGALGGKILGAGKAGYMMFFVTPEKRNNFIYRMREKNLESVDFEIDFNGLSTRIV